MMRRLRDESQAEPAAARAAQLLRSAAPLAVAPAQRARIWLGVVGQEPTRHSARRPWLELAAALMLAAVAATAVVGWTVLTRRGSPAVADGAAPGPQLTPRDRAPARPALAPSGEPARGDREGPPVEPTSQPRPRPLDPGPEPSEVPPEPPAPGSQPSRPESIESVAPPAPPRAGTPDSTLVLEAVRALRRERDSYRASQLVYTYLCTHPDGPLAEEALGLAIDAAASRRDERVVPLADRYLARFPNGRYAAAARRARARFAEVAKARGATTWTIPCGATR